MATKRSNPFIEDFMPQSKVHVSLKQFNNNEDRLRKVYEKTLKLLFKGAKKSISNDVNHQDADVVKQRDGMKQLVIGRDGSLHINKAKVQHKPTTIMLCSCGASCEVQCNYCEKALCTLCQCLCSRCEKYYCSQCSLIRFEDAEMCVSCYE